MNSPATDQDPDAAALAALRKGIRNPGVPLFYTLGLALVAAAMVLLPLVYLTMVAAAAYAVFWHATTHFHWLTGSGSPHFTFLKFLVYCTILAAGIVVVFFLLKPLFARQPRRAQPLALHPGAEPRLFAFIEAVCRAVHAPKPRRIDLDCRLNASAGFRRGFFSFLGDDLVLTLGLPLVANLTVDELAGVIAHEFGHFTQGLAMRLAYVIDRVNFWFVRVVHQRDAWDEILDEMAANPDDWRIGIVVWIAQAGVGLSRLLLRACMAVGVAISGFLSRQMEYHADACEIRLAGSENFERVTRKLATLSHALQHTYKGVHQGWQHQGNLPDNLPELIRRVHDDLPDDVVHRIHDTLGLHRTRWFHTHPCPAARIRRARLAAQPGILSDDRPAAALFERFDVPARQVTELHYTDDLGLQITPEALLPLAPLQSDLDPDNTPIASRQGSYREQAPPPLRQTLLLNAPELLLPLPLQPLPNPAPQPPPDTPETAAQLTDLVSSLALVQPQIADLALHARTLGPRLAWGDEPPAHDVTCAPDNPDNPDERPTPDPTPPAADRPTLRHAAREVIDATAHRLNLGLLLALPSLNTAETEHLETFHAWLRAAHDDFEIRSELSRTLPTLIRDFSKASLNGDPPDPLLQQVHHIQSQRARLVTEPKVHPPEENTARKLRLGPHANTLRELDALEHETRAWFATYRFALSGLWELAGREERRLFPDPPSTS